MSPAHNSCHLCRTSISTYPAPLKLQPYSAIQVLLLLLLLGRVALGAQRPIVIKLSRVRSVGRSVRRSV